MVKIYLFLSYNVIAVCFVCLGYFLRTRASPIQRSFQGCMQLIQVDDQLADLTAVEQGRMGAFENVSLDMCAIIDRSEPTLLPFFPALPFNKHWLRQWLSGAADWDCGFIPTGSICPGGRICPALPALPGVDLLHSSTSMANEEFNQRADAERTWDRLSVVIFRLILHTFTLQGLAFCLLWIQQRQIPLMELYWWYGTKHEEQDFPVVLRLT